MKDETSLSTEECSKNSRLINRVLLITACFMPLGFFPFPGIDIFDVIKGPLITLSALTLTFLVIRDRKFDKSLVTKLLIAYIILALLASIFAINPLLAFIGAIPKYGRYEGFITIMSYVILFYSAKNYLILTKRKIHYFLISLIIIGLYALVQHFQYDPLVIYMRYPPIVFSTIGNQNFLASLMVMTIPIPCGLYFMSNNKKDNLFYLFAAFVLFGALIASFTRSAWLAFIIIYLISFFIVVKYKVSILKFSIITLVFCSSIGFLNLNYNSKSVYKRSVSIKKEFDLSNEYAGSGRYKIWSITIKVIKKHPYLGVGPENLKPCLKKEFKKELKEYYRMKRNTIDKAHNEFLHVAAVNGIPALLILISIYCLNFIKLYKERKNNINKLLFIIILGYLGQSFFNISVIAVAPVFWIILGYSFQKEKMFYSKTISSSPSNDA
tara:strand:- start:698 stop:2014 length:1317 start_codon:yes stop_codon:yes gene_type:complete